MRTSLITLAVFAAASLSAVSGASASPESCIRKQCAAVYDDCVRRQDSDTQSKKWIRKHCSSQYRGCENSCKRTAWHDPPPKKKPPGGPPLTPPSSLR